MPIIGISAQTIKKRVASHAGGGKTEDCSKKTKGFRPSFADELLEKYKQGLYDLPTLALMLHGIPTLDVADYIQRSIPHEERWQEVEKIRKNTKLPKDGIPILVKLYIG